VKIKKICANTFDPGGCGDLTARRKLKCFGLGKEARKEKRKKGTLRLWEARMETTVSGHSCIRKNRNQKKENKKKEEGGGVHLPRKEGEKWRKEAVNALIHLTKGEKIERYLSNSEKRICGKKR